jgi:hypothetical protein
MEILLSTMEMLKPRLYDLLGISQRDFDIYCECRW